MPKVGVGIPTMNFFWTNQVLPDLIENTKYRFNLYLPDDETKETSRAELKRHEDIINEHILKKTSAIDKLEITYTDGSRLGISHAWNRIVLGALADDCDYIMILNNDVAFPNVKEGQRCWLEKMVDFMEKNPKVGWSGPMWLWCGSPVTEDGFTKFKNSVEAYEKEHAGKIIDGGFACFMMLRADMVRDLMKKEKDKACIPNCGLPNEPHPGLFDRTNFLVNWEDVDYILRARRYGWQTCVTHDCTMAHMGSGTTGSEEWGGRISEDCKRSHVKFCTKFGLPHPDTIGGFRVSSCIYEFEKGGLTFRVDGAEMRKKLGEV